MQKGSSTTNQGVSPTRAEGVQIQSNLNYQKLANQITALQLRNDMLQKELASKNPETSQQRTLKTLDNENSMLRNKLDSLKSSF